jgi:ribonucleoside-diphosphate reductase alpha chain
MATHFPGMRPEWSQNSRRERLLGVDLNGEMDCPVVQSESVLQMLKELAVQTNAEYAAKLGIEQSVAVTTVKPSGNSSQLLNASSGIHSRWAPYYIRNVRVSNASPIFKVLQEEGVPMDPENGFTRDNATTWVVHFPMKSPDGSITRNGRSAVEQCEYWKKVRLNYTEHNPSATITYKPSEVIDIVKWVWENQAIIGGLTFLPSFDAQYDQMPYEEISEQEYNTLAQRFPNIDFSKIFRYEESDLTTASQELACMGGHCEM